MTRPPPKSPLFPYTTLFRSDVIDTIFDADAAQTLGLDENQIVVQIHTGSRGLGHQVRASRCGSARSEEHTSELQSHVNIVCRLLLEKKKKNINRDYTRANNA